jgi:hypothetical protein
MRGREGDPPRTGGAAQAEDRILLTWPRGGRSTEEGSAWEGRLNGDQRTHTEKKGHVGTGGATLGPYVAVPHAVQPVVSPDACRSPLVHVPAHM